MKIGIVGLGLIGGSLAKRFKASSQTVVIEACDTDKNSLDKALSSGVINSGVSSIEALSKDLDIVFVCTPISVTVESMKAVVNHVSNTSIVTDVASIKGSIASQVSGANVVPGHPIAGTQFSGFSASDGEIMEGATYVLIPTKENQNAITNLSSFLSQVGFQVVTLSAEEHDNHLAATSHVPYFLAVALRDHVDSKNVPENLKGTGFKSTTRVAGMPASWGDDVLRENREAITFQLQEIIDRLNQYR